MMMTNKQAESLHKEYERLYNPSSLWIEVRWPTMERENAVISYGTLHSNGMKERKIADVSIRPDGTIHTQHYL